MGKWWGTDLSHLTLVNIRHLVKAACLKPHCGWYSPAVRSGVDGCSVSSGLWMWAGRLFLPLGNFWAVLAGGEGKTGIDLFLVWKGSAPGVFWDVNLDFALQLWEILLPGHLLLVDVWLMGLGVRSAAREANQLPSSSIFGCETFAKATNSPERLGWTFLYGYI